MRIISIGATWPHGDCRLWKRYLGLYFWKRTHNAIYKYTSCDRIRRHPCLAVVVCCLAPLDWVGVKTAISLSCCGATGIVNWLMHNSDNCSFKNYYKSGLANKNRANLNVFSNRKFSGFRCMKCSRECGVKRLKGGLIN